MPVDEEEFCGFCPDTGHTLHWEAPRHRPTCPVCGPLHYEPPEGGVVAPKNKFSIEQLLRDIGYRYEESSGRIEIIPVKQEKPPKPPKPEKRIGRMERDAAITELRIHLEEDRITLAEFEERMSAAAEARYPSQLAALTEDLPAVPLQQRIALPRPPAAPRKPPVDAFLDRLTAPRKTIRISWGVVCVIAVWAYILLTLVHH